MMEPTTIRKLGLAPYGSFAMIAGMQLELFTPLGAGSLSAADLAKALAVKVDKLEPLLYALVEAGLLEFSGGLFANTAEANHFLVKGKPSYLGGSHSFYVSRFKECFSTAESIRAAAPQAKLDFANMSEADLTTYYEGMHPSSLSSGRALATKFDFTKYKRVLDVGGGSGGLCISLAEAYPHLELSVVDLPSVTPFTQDFVTKAGLQERIRVVPHDIVTTSLEGFYDFAVIRAVIQVLSRKDAALLLKHVFAVLEPGGFVYLGGHVLDDSRLSPAQMVAFNLVFLNVYDEGQAYTESEYRAWFSQAGFVDVERTVVTGGSSMFTARKPS